MTQRLKSAIGKLSYALLFIVVIPIGLWIWAKETNSILNWPAVGGVKLGCLLLIIGLVIIIWSMYLLKKKGKGLPMNAFPPLHFVQSGPYKLFKHPIYWGFIFLILGFFIIKQLPSGIWLVTPTVILAIFALVWGYEKIDLENRFPNQKIKTILRIPEHGVPVSLRDRLAASCWILLTIIIGNFFTRQFLDYNLPTYAKILANLESDCKVYYKIIPIIFIISTIFIIQHKHLLRHWLIVTLLAYYLILFINIIWPESNLNWYTYMGSLLSPGFTNFADVFAVPMCLIFISLHCIFKESKIIALPWLGIAGFIEYKNINLNMLRMEYVLFYITVYIICINYYSIWVFLIKSAQFIANSWQEWTFFGKLRVLSHGFYVGAGTFMGIISASMLVGKEYSWAILIFTIVILVCSLIWAQIIEGSEKLKRPFGYYGGLIGAAVAAIIMYILGYNFWIVLAVISVVMPRSQAVGRLRCLVNGCCHGSKVKNEDFGIRYFHKKSRVANISGLAGEPLHPTPLYSMIWLFITSFIMLSMWLHQMPFSLICGSYLILTGIGRFIEEAYRGEVQTIIYKGLRLYQWTALISVIVGIILTVVHTGSVDIKPTFSWEILIPAAIGGILVNIAMGVDFPKSESRFSRLV